MEVVESVERNFGPRVSGEGRSRRLGKLLIHINTLLRELPPAASAHPHGGWHGLLTDPHGHSPGVMSHAPGLTPLRRRVMQ